MTRPARTPAVAYVLTGQHPATAVVHRFTVYEDDSLLLERTDYVSTHEDGWRQVFPPLRCHIRHHTHLMDTIRDNPAIWPL